MCCPTPDAAIDCHPEKGCVSASQCRQGPIQSNSNIKTGIVFTKYVETIHKKAPGIYAYSYDDFIGLHRCPSEVAYSMIYCPANAPSYPGHIKPQK
jgi:hypothetical protein